MAKQALPTILLLSLARLAFSWNTLCAWVPIPMQHEVEGCTDYRGDSFISVAGSEGCASWCSWVPVLAWHYPDGCAFCGRNVGQMAGVTEKESAREIVEKPDTVGEQTLRSKSHTTAASWCKWVPHGALKHVRNCQSVEAKSLPVMAGCEEWCQWIPEPAWRNPRGCRRCSQSEIIP